VNVALHALKCECSSTFSFEKLGVNANLSIYTNVKQKAAVFRRVYDGTFYGVCFNLLKNII